MTEHIRILRRPEVQARTGLSRSSIYSAMEGGTFPKSVKLGVRAVGWRDDDIAEWIIERPTRNIVGGV